MGENSSETLGEKSKWESYIEKTKRSRVNDLHILSKLIWMNQKNKRALSLGTGSGSEVVDLIIYLSYYNKVSERNTYRVS